LQPEYRLIDLAGSDSQPRIEFSSGFHALEIAIRLAGKVAQPLPIDRSTQEYPLETANPRPIPPEREGDAA
jgi:hypothetical protein